jgi:hypothetical protein
VIGVFELRAELVDLSSLPQNEAGETVDVEQLAVVVGAGQLA